MNRQSSKPRIHCMGIGGSGMSAIAALAHAEGYQVTGCDKAADTEYLAPLRALNIPIFKTHDVAHLLETDFLLYSPAVSKMGDDIAEYQQGVSKLPHATWQSFFGQHLQQGKQVISVAGTHGKGTVAALISDILIRAGKDPTSVLGVSPKAWRCNWRIGQSTLLIHEADEFNDNFLNYMPSMIVLTNLEMDHPEYFDSFLDLQDSFVHFINKLPSGGKIICRKDDPVIASLLSKVNVASLQVVDYERVVLPENLSLFLQPAFNQSNAKAAIAACRVLAINDATIFQSLAEFEGLKRRYELVYDNQGLLVYNDYAHHPTAVNSVLSALKAQYPKRRLIAVFQPHMYTRTKALFDDFSAAFSKADIAVVSDIFAAREKDEGVISSRDLVKAIKGPKAIYGGDLPHTAQTVFKLLEPNDVVVFMGAGDIGQGLEKLLSLVNEKMTV